MLVRSFCAAALVAAGCGAFPAEAAAKPPCKLLVDARGDTTLADTPGLDVLSADVVSDSRRVTVVLRLAGSPSSYAPTSPAGHVYTVRFSGHGGTAPVFVTYVTTPTGSVAKYGRYHAEAEHYEAFGNATARVAGNAVHLTLPLASLAPYVSFARGTRITGLTAFSYRWVGAFATPEAYVHNSPEADRAKGGKPYVAGSRSCIRVE